jgi:hypothetical protein
MIKIRLFLIFIHHFASVNSNIMTENQFNDEFYHESISGMKN